MASDQADQPFDLIVLAYAPTFLAPERADFGHVDVPGFKVAGYAAFLREHRDIIERYERVALIDDDIETDSAAIARAFELGRAHDLELWQPSLTWDSYFSYAALLRSSKGDGVRPVNFVEMMCPFFKTAALIEVIDLFDIGAETGIDIFWSCVLGRRPGTLAVLDTVSVKHTRPVGALRSMNGFDDDSGYGDVIAPLLARFAVAFPGAIPLGSPATAEPSFATRLRSATAMLRLASGLAQTPMLWRRFILILCKDIVGVLFNRASITGDPAGILEVARQLGRSGDGAMAATRRLPFAASSRSNLQISESPTR